jgi:hypothetical protein
MFRIKILVLFLVFAAMAGTSFSQSKYLDKESNFTLGIFDSYGTDRDINANEAGLSFSFNSTFELGLGKGVEWYKIPDIDDDEDNKISYLFGYAEYIHKRREDGLLSVSLGIRFIKYSEITGHTFIPVELSFFREVRILKGLSINPKAGITKILVTGNPEIVISPLFVFGAAIAYRPIHSIALIVKPNYAIHKKNDVMGVSAGLCIRSKK